MKNIEYKFTPLASLKMIDSGPGTISGYRAVFNEIDEGGDLIIPGFFADTIPEFLSAGFSAQSHVWDFSQAVGFPVEAKEDGYGFFVTSQFHSTDDAQKIRTKAKERMEAGKQVGFSFGYSVLSHSYIEPRDYKTLLPQYVRPDRLEANMMRAQKFSRIRILKKGEVIEDSIVTAPMNKLARATHVKHLATRGDVERLRAESLALSRRAARALNDPFARIDEALDKGNALRLRSESIRLMAELTLRG